MAKTRLNLTDDLQVESVVLANLLPNDARVLFIYNEDYERIKKICKEKNITATIMNDDVSALEKARNYNFDILFGNINAGQLNDVADKSFDCIVAEDVIKSARYPSDFLLEMLKKTDNLIISNTNRAHWKKRLKFLFTGSMYISNQYDVIPDDKYAWFNRDPWTLSHKDIMHLCTCSSLSVKQGVMIYRNGIIDNIYDIRSSPNFHADKVYYVITNDGGVEPLYKIGTPVFS